MAWLTKDFKERVAEIWKKPVKAKTNLEKWLIKGKRVKTYLKGWELKVKEMRKKNKSRSPGGAVEPREFGGRWNA